MKHLITFLFFLLFLSLCSFNAAEEKISTNGDLSDWIYIDEGCMEGCFGAFHDYLSGAFIDFEVSATQLLGEDALNVAKKNSSSVVTLSNESKIYHMVSIDEGREAYIKATCPRGGVDHPQAVVVSLTEQNQVPLTRNFTALACNPYQRERVVDFITHGHQWIDLMRGKNNKRPQTAEFADLTVGMTWDNVQKILRGDIMPSAYQGGFVITYHIADTPKHLQLGWLFFDQQRRLESVATSDPQIPIYPGPPS